MNIKKYSIGLLLSIISLTGLHAQQAVLTTGGDATGIGGSVSYSIGQVADTTNQGVQQPYEFATVGIDDNKNISLHCSVFPNPAAAYVILKIESQDLQNLRVELFDINGRLLFNNSINNTQTIIPMENFPQAAYLLRVTDNKSTLETFKIIKNQ